MASRNWTAGSVAVAIGLALGGGGGIVQAANVISVTASGGGAYTIVSSGGDDQIVELDSPGTFTITADEDSTGANSFDGYINTVRFGSGATDGTYNVRIARNTAGDFYSTGARNVGWVDLASGSKRGNLGMVVIDGRWGYKKSGGGFTNCDPSSGEITRLYEAKKIGTDNQQRFVIGTYTPDGGSGAVTAGGEIIANSDGDSTSRGVGSIDVPVLIDGSTTSTGLIEAKTRSGSGGQLLKKIDIDTDHGGAVTIGSSSALGSTAWVRINRFGAPNGQWLSGATVRVAGTTYGRPTINAQNPYPQSYIDDRVYWVSAVKGDMQGDHVMNNFDTDAFVLALESASSYNTAFPWLAESRVFHGDVGPVDEDVCTPDAVFNNFDIDCFVDLLTG